MKYTKIYHAAMFVAVILLAVLAWERIQIVGRLKPEIERLTEERDRLLGSNTFLSGRELPQYGILGSWIVDTTECSAAMIEGWEYEKRKVEEREHLKDHEYIRKERKP